MKIAKVFWILGILIFLSYGRPLRAFQKCQGDVEKFCKEVQPGKGQVMQCLQSKQDLLTQDCRQALTERREKHQQMRLTCKADREKFCAGVKPGKGAVHACMESHETELNPECRAQLQKRGKFHAVKEACRNDKEKFCKDVQPGDGRIKACMKTHSAELSNECRGKMEEMKQWKASRSSAWEGIRTPLI